MGKKIKVTTEELEKASNSLIYDNYYLILTNL